jgi:translocation and assembly module TamB
MAIRRKLKRIAIIAAAVIFALIVAGFFVLRSRMFHQYVLGIVVNRAEEATGARVQIGGFAWDLPALRVDLYRIAVHGTEPNPAQPLLSVNHIEVELKIISLLGGNFGIRTLEIDRPVVHLIVQPNGTSNLPPSQLTSQSNKPSSNSSSPLSLAVDHFGLHQGAIIVNDHQMLLNAALQGLHAQAAFNSQKREYDGFLAYRSGDLQLAQYAPLWQSLDAHFTVAA